MGEGDSRSVCACWSTPSRTCWCPFWPLAPQPGIPWHRAAASWATASSCSWSRVRRWSQEVKQVGQDVQCGKPPLEPRAHAWHLSPEMPSLQRQAPVYGSQLGEMEPCGLQEQAVGGERVGEVAGSTRLRLASRKQPEGGWSCASGRVHTSPCLSHCSEQNCHLPWPERPSAWQPLGRKTVQGYRGSTAC